MAKNIKKQAQKVRKQGRGGDTVLAHISPEEDRFLTQIAGGKKSRNPKTGLPEHLFGIDDAIIGSILMSAGIGAVSAAAQGGNPLKGALIGGLGGALVQGIGGAIGGSAGAGAAAASETISPALAAADPTLMNGVSEAFKSAAEPGLMEMMGGKIKDFATSPGGVITGIGAIGAMTDDSDKQQKKIEKELEELRKKDKDYPVIPPLSRTLQYADGGKVKGDDYVDDVYSAAYKSGGSQQPVGALENLYADPYLFRGYTQNAQGQQKSLPPSYIPTNTVYNMPNIDDILLGVQGDIAGQIRGGIEEYGGNMLSRLPELLGISGGGSGAGTGGAGIGGSSEQNFFPQDTSKPAAAAAPPPPPVKIVGFHPGAEGTGRRGEPSYMTLSDGRYIDLTGVERGRENNLFNFMAILNNSYDDPNAGPQKGYINSGMNLLKEGKLDETLNPMYAHYNWGGRTYRDILHEYLPDAFASGGHVSGIGGGKEDRIPAMLSDGEHVVTADEVSMLGDGSNNRGQQKMYNFRQNIRKHKTGKSRPMPKAKQPERYAGIGGA